MYCMARQLGSSDNGTLNGIATSTPKPSVRAKTGSVDGSDGSADVMAMFTETNRKLDLVLEKMGKLDTIEANLGKLTSDVSNLEARVKSLEGSANDYGESLDFMSHQIDDLNEKHVNMDNVTKELKRHATMIETMSRSLEAVRRERGEMREKVTDLQWRSMKTNLVFTGLGKESNDEDTEDKLRIFLFNELGIDRPIQFGNVHRFGRHITGRNRPIVARFLYNKDRMMVKGRAFMLRDTPYGIHEQLPQAMEDRRKELYPVMRRLRDEGNRVRMVRDKLIVNGRLYDESLDDNYYDDQQVDDDCEQDNAGEIAAENGEGATGAGTGQMDTDSAGAEPANQQ